uniref:Uncharacterized protein n=1 Tax=Chromera velia CCMP2878 TaxID=1169474 RepID=A0A0G4GTA4_9ALVE|eukprot:Cvel_23283.t1-p1 / transcript=Cvel_23283.t1 / gene=Cvel_23283 / organism=Chromera_velia_CCMP2878 / gene_product=hypothetical protein / transcript_product=hypothetical protein / location=Cvel_scaffold2383:321-3362(+) / protein_length=396 / sequence_SO=supercontig / SO=protein_coding / is_pseudo=false
MSSHAASRRKPAPVLLPEREEERAEEEYPDTRRGGEKQRQGTQNGQSERGRQRDRAPLLPPTGKHSRSVSSSSGSSSSSLAEERKRSRGRKREKERRHSKSVGSREQREMMQAFFRSLLEGHGDSEDSDSDSHSSSRRRHRKGRRGERERQGKRDYRYGREKEDRFPPSSSSASRQTRRGDDRDRGRGRDPDPKFFVTEEEKKRMREQRLAAWRAANPHLVQNPPPLHPVTRRLMASKDWETYLKASQEERYRLTQKYLAKEIAQYKGFFSWCEDEGHGFDEKNPMAPEYRAHVQEQREKAMRKQEREEEEKRQNEKQEQKQKQARAFLPRKASGPPSQTTHGASRPSSASASSSGWRERERQGEGEGQRDRSGCRDPITRGGRGGRNSRGQRRGR